MKKCRKEKLEELEEKNAEYARLRDEAGSLKHLSNRDDNDGTHDKRRCHKC